MMKITVLTIFPELFDCFLDTSLIKRGVAKNILSINVIDLRGYTFDIHRTVDDSPYGGGSGMVMKPEPFFHAAKDIFKQKSVTSYKKGKYKTKKVIYFTPRGTPLTQEKLKELKDLREIVIFCGRYEGIDERVIEHLVDEEISIGDFIVQGGELPAMIFMEGVTRLLPKFIGKESSLIEESFEKGLLEYPQYTRPAEFVGLKVPDVLQSGNHEAIRKWREREALEKTRKMRPDLLQK